MKLFEKIKNLILGLGNRTNYKPRIILESSSPNCHLHAIVEEDDRCTYMYLIIKDEDGIKGHLGTCWLGNHKQSPKDWEIDQMREGISPMMPIEYCNHPKGKPKFNPENLKLVWFEEGAGIALLEDNEIVGIIPYWSDDQNPSYSRDMIKEYNLQFPLGENNELTSRVRNSQEFWELVFESEEDWWEEFRSPRLNILDKEFGQHSKYYAIDGNQWPPKAMLRYEVKDMTYLITVGVSLIPQPKVEIYQKNPSDSRRIELAMAIKTKELAKNENDILAFVSGLTNTPWHELTWLGHGHTLDTTLFLKDQISYMLCIEGSKDKNLPQIKFPKYRGDPINILWLHHITEADFENIRAEGVTKYLKEKNLEQDYNKTRNIS